MNSRTIKFLTLTLLFLTLSGIATSQNTLPIEKENPTTSTGEVKYTELKLSHDAPRGTELPEEWFFRLDSWAYDGGKNSQGIVSSLGINSDTAYQTALSEGNASIGVNTPPYINERSRSNPLHLTEWALVTEFENGEICAWYQENCFQVDQIIKEKREKVRNAVEGVELEQKGIDKWHQEISANISLHPRYIAYIPAAEKSPREEYQTSITIKTGNEEKILSSLSGRTGNQIRIEKNHSASYLNRESIVNTWDAEKVCTRFMGVELKCQDFEKPVFEEEEEDTEKEEQKGTVIEPDWRNPVNLRGDGIYKLPNDVTMNVENAGRIAGTEQRMIEFEVNRTGIVDSPLYEVTQGTNTREYSRKMGLQEPAYFVLYHCGEDAFNGSHGKDIIFTENYIEGSCEQISQPEQENYREAPTGEPFNVTQGDIYSIGPDKNQFFKVQNIKPVDISGETRTKINILANSKTKTASGEKLFYTIGTYYGSRNFGGTEYLFYTCKRNENTAEILITTQNNNSCSSQSSESQEEKTSTEETSGEKSISIQTGTPTLNTESTVNLSVPNSIQKEYNPVLKDPSGEKIADKVFSQNEKSISFTPNTPGNYTVSIYPTGTIQSIISTITGPLAQKKLAVPQTGPDTPAWKAYCTNNGYSLDDVQNQVNCIKQDIVPTYFESDTEETRIPDSLCQDLLGRSFSPQKNACTSGEGGK